MIGYLLIWLLVAELHYAQSACSVNCSSTCYTDSITAMNCLESYPFNLTWAETTIDVLSQSLENFGFGALYHNTGPPYSISMDVQGELRTALSKAQAGQFATDLAFQEYVQGIFQQTLDAHTRYQKPKCYDAVFVQPFAFDMRVDNTSTVVEEPKVYLMRNIYTDVYSTVYNGYNVNEVIGAQVVLVNGVELTSEVSSWGDTHETRSNNQGVRFNAAIRSYLYRSAVSTSVVPINDLTITVKAGNSLREYTFPWLASYGKKLGNITTCTVPQTTSQEVAPARRRLYDEPDSTMTPVPMDGKILHLSRPDREVIIAPNSPYQVSCFVQTMTGVNSSKTGVSKVLVMKVASFSPDGTDYLDAWSGFLGEVEQCLSVDFDLIVVDVMQNGGGYVCLGLRLIELLVEEYDNDHVLVQMNYDLPHSTLMDAYINVVNAPDPYPDPEKVEQILDRSTQKAFPDGRAYYYPGRNVTMGGVSSWRTNYFSLNCTEAEAMPKGFKPKKYMPPEKLIILTDGTCGSTCASFTKIPQEAGKATFVGAGGIWGVGMDVSSFAGGFVCNPGYLADIAEWSRVTFPKFLTDQSWQFGW